MALKLQKKHEKMVFDAGIFSRSELRHAMTAIRCVYFHLDRGSTILVVPDEGLERPVWLILRRLFGQPDETAESRKKALDSFFDEQIHHGFVIHVLEADLPLCGFTNATWAQWPPNHEWVGIGESSHANCPECKRVAKLKHNRERK